MNYFKTTVMSICIMLIIVALPAKGGPPNRDLDVIATFLADTVPFQANTVLHASHMGKCGEDGICLERHGVRQNGRDDV